MNTKKKELQRIDWNMVKIILRLLYYHNNERKTNLAAKTKLNYSKFKLYLEWLDLIGFIQVENDFHGHETVKLTESGSEFFTKKINIDTQAI